MSILGASFESQCAVNCSFVRLSVDVLLSIFIARDFEKHTTSRTETTNGNPIMCCFKQDSMFREFQEIVQC